MKKIYWIVILLLFIVSCSKNRTEENIKLNKIVHSVLKYESDRRALNENIYLVNPKLLRLQIYTPSQKEMLGEEPGPPPFFNKSVVHLLDLKKSRPEERKSDSVYLLQQNQYIFDSLKVDSKINHNIKLATKEDINNRIKFCEFSNPVYFKDGYAYIESRYFDSAFGIGFGYLLEKQKEGNWMVKKVINTFIT